MKRFLPILFAMFLILGCKKEEPEVIPPLNSIAQDLKQVIESEGVNALKACCLDCGCDPYNNYDQNYAFVGDNFIVINGTTYNLSVLVKYHINTAPNNFKCMMLRFH